MGQGDALRLRATHKKQLVCTRKAEVPGIPFANTRPNTLTAAAFLGKGHRYGVERLVEPVSKTIDLPLQVQQDSRAHKRTAEGIARQLETRTWQVDPKRSHD
jgi:hypothetical protein